MEPRAEQRKRSLIEDDKFVVRGKFGDEHWVRLRIWRGANATAIVLASPARDEKGRQSVPSRFSAKIANLAVSMAGYPEAGILYYEYDSVVGFQKPQLRQVHFDLFGHDARMRLYRPMFRNFEWEALEKIVGEPIER